MEANEQTEATNNCRHCWAVIADEKTHCPGCEAEFSDDASTTQAPPVDPDRVRADHLFATLATAKTALMEAVCVADTKDREKAKRLVRLWRLVAEEME